MANTFFDFDSSLNNGENVLPPDEDDCLENEEEYDALNDETFGALEDSSSLDDWEQQHEQFAEIAEHSKHPDHLENSISQLVLDESEDRLSLSSSVWSYTPSSNNGDVFNTSILSSLQKASKSFIEAHTDSSTKSIDSLDSTPPLLPAQPKKICTVEELEKSLIKSSKNASQQSLERNQLHHQPQLPRPILPLPGHSFHPLLQHQMANAPRLPPPGLPPMSIPPPGLCHVGQPMSRHPAMLPPGMLRLMPPHPQFMQANGPPRPPGFMYPPGGSQNQYPVSLGLLFGKLWLGGRGIFLLVSRVVDVTV
ncbi:hypothetical protein JTB14_029565 [Gonioctena quinquepunctata]|nr:hypothetical protein JTB14_029565 [Gonioctena quinquepunctata]